MNGKHPERPLHSPMEPPIEIAETRFLRADSDSGPELFPYISLRRVSARVVDGPSGGKARKEQLNLHFDAALVVITGQGVFQLLPEIQHERLFAVRAGVPEDLKAPHIEMVEVIEQDASGHSGKDANDGSRD